MLTEREELAVIADLSAGYGIEDIAVRRKIIEKGIHSFVADMRAKGTLRLIYWPESDDEGDSWVQVGDAAGALVRIVAERNPATGRLEPWI